jgi:hypothetical protein
MTTTRAVRRLLSEKLGAAGAALAFLVAAVHLFHPQRGFLRLLVLLTTGNASLLASDPRPLAFVLSALAILVGVPLAAGSVARRAVYLLGMALVATYFVGYFAWHLSGHGGFLPGRAPLYHGLGPVEAVVSHLRTYPMAALSKAAEAALFAVLVVLYRREF